jgi:hypothetical protein
MRKIKLFRYERLTRGFMRVISWDLIPRYLGLVALEHDYALHYGVENVLVSKRFTRCVVSHIWLAKCYCTRQCPPMTVGHWNGMDWTRLDSTQIRLNSRPISGVYFRNDSDSTRLYSILLSDDGTSPPNSTAVRLFVLASVSLSVCLSVRLSVCLSVRLSVCLSVRPSVRLSVCPSVHPSASFTVVGNTPMSISALYDESSAKF